jgi:HSP20 family protein
MFRIIRRDPFRDLMRLSDSMDRMFDDPFMDLDWDVNQPTGGTLALDVVEKDDEFVVSAALPGLDPDDLDISVSGNTLNIKGEIKEEQEKEAGQYHLHERRYGSFARSITLPTTIDSKTIEANYVNGVLKLHLPKSEEAKPRRIPVKTSLPKMIEGKVREITGKN